MGGKASRDKGAAFEREIVNWHREKNVEAERIPLSGSVKGSFAGDLIIGPWQDLYDALDQDGSDMLFIRKDRERTLVVLPLETYEAFLEWIGWKEN